MRFDGWNTIEGRHLVYIYAVVILIQGGYFVWVASQWLKLGRFQCSAELEPTSSETKKSTRPV
jgi:hypothetical protein